MFNCVKFSHFKDKDHVLKMYREIRKERSEAADGLQAENAEDGDDNVGNPVRVSEDFPQKVTKACTKLFPFL